MFAFTIGIGTKLNEINLTILVKIPIIGNAIILSSLDFI